MIHFYEHFIRHPMMYTTRSWEESLRLWHLTQTLQQIRGA